jgi:hypothetical protein
MLGLHRDDGAGADDIGVHVSITPRGGGHCDHEAIRARLERCLQRAELSIPPDEHLTRSTNPAS